MRSELTVSSREVDETCASNTNKTLHDYDDTARIDTQILRNRIPSKVANSIDVKYVYIKKIFFLNLVQTLFFVKLTNFQFEENDFLKKWNWLATKKIPILAAPLVNTLSHIYARLGNTDWSQKEFNYRWNIFEFQLFSAFAADAPFITIVLFELAGPTIAFGYPIRNHRRL